MSKYRIQATIEASRLPQLVGLLYEDVSKFDPELKIYRIVEYATAPEAAPKPEPELAARNWFPPEPANVRDQQPYVSMDEVIGKFLQAGPRRWLEMHQALAANGFSPESIGSVIKRKQKNGTIQRTEDGLWSLPDAS